MEQRNSDRKAVSLDAVIGCSRFGLIRGRIVDLGYSGLYISAETSIVPIGASVTVTFQPDPDSAAACLNIRGWVAHQSLQGFGVAFDDLDAHCREALDRLLPAMPPVPNRAVPVLRAI
jgi:hypothetical protein